MNLRVVTCLGLLMAAVAVACKNDPTADLAGQPAAIFASPNPLVVAVDDSGTITVLVISETATPLPVNVTAAVTTGQAFATVRLADVLPDPTGTVHVFQVNGVAAGEATVRLTGGGVTYSATVTVE